MRELEAELEAEQRRARDLAAENRKLQRLLQEQKQQADDERRLAAEANEQINQLQARIKTLKRQLEEAVMTYTQLLQRSACVVYSVHFHVCSTTMHCTAVMSFELTLRADI